MKLVYTIAFLLITACILTHSQLGIGYSLLGLNLWFEKMIPALFPFMILSGIMIRMRLTENFSRLLYPVIRPVYKVSRNACYAMIMGFFCGFPMGAKTIADLSKRNMLSAQEAEFLLAFCNNIGPVYFCGFVLPLLGRELLLPYVFGMYGIPLIYGFLLRKTLYRHLNLSAANIRNVAITEASPSLQDTVFSLKTNSHKHAPVLPNHKDKTSGSELSVKVSAPQSLLYEIDDAVNSSIQSILSLGGYMILFNLLNLPFHIICGKTPVFLAPLLEITGGLKLSAAASASSGRILYMLLLLPFGGLSCIAQTNSCIKGTGLSLTAYTIHKIALTIFTGIYYLLWFLLSPSSFLR